MSKTISKSTSIHSRETVKAVSETISVFAKEDDITGMSESEAIFETANSGEAGETVILVKISTSCRKGYDELIIEIIQDIRMEAAVKQVQQEYRKATVEKEYHHLVIFPPEERITCYNLGCHDTWSVLTLTGPQCEPYKLIIFPSVWGKLCVDVWISLQTRLMVNFCHERKIEYDTAFSGSLPEKEDDNYCEEEIKEDCDIKQTPMHIQDPSIR